MSRVFSVWSYKHGWGTSTILALIARSISSNVKEKILCIDMQQKYGTLLHYIGDSNSENRVNMNDLLAIAETSHLNKEVIERCIQKTSIPNVSLITCGQSSQFNYADNLLSKNKKVFDEVMLQLKEQFDIILIDSPSGTSSMVSKYFIDTADILVNVMKQERVYLTQLYRDLGNTNFLSNDKVISIINYYDDSLSITDTFIKKELGLKNIITLPYNSTLREKVNEGTVKDISIDEYSKMFRPIFSIFESDISNVDEPKELNAYQKTKKKFLNLIRK